MHLLVYELNELQNAQCKDKDVFMFISVLFNEAVSNVTIVALNNTEVSKAVIGKCAEGSNCNILQGDIPEFTQGYVENLDKPQLELLDAIPAYVTPRTQVGKANYCLNSFLCMKDVPCLERNRTRPFSW